ncbi:MAG: hypothetical protein EPO07_16135 [Verrucomicrobia bacterium]|nr:MAG: hypothetical protein EPO07_16135 [Verrucomicrobiota bacterium]
MLNQRQRAVVWAAAGLVAIWAAGFAGYTVFQHLKVTAEKVRAYVESVDLSKLSGDARARAIQKLADMLNRLSPEERRQMRLGRAAESWFTQMTEEEKGQFIEATMPAGFKQMITAFEQQPEDKRKRAIDDALKRLREANTQAGAGAGTRGTNRPPLSPELEAKVRSIGLQTFYSQSSAQTKAELAPVLEELQRSMESGRMGRGR